MPWSFTTGSNILMAASRPERSYMISSHHFSFGSRQSIINHLTSDPSTRHLAIDPNFNNQGAIELIADVFANPTYRRIFLDVARTLPEFAHLSPEEDFALVLVVAQALQNYTRSSE